MKRILLATLALGVMTTAVAAEPVKLEDAQMDGVTAGVLDNFRLSVAIPVTVVNGVALATAVGVLAENISSGALADVDGGNLVGIGQGDD